MRVVQVPDGPIILDTNVVSELIRPRPSSAVVKLLELVSHRSLITSVVLGELYLGAHLCPEGKRKTTLLAFSDAVRDAYADRTIALTPEIAQHYAASTAELLHAGVTMSVNAAYIAAAAVTSEAVLMTRNMSDFEHYPGIEMVNPWDVAG